MPISNDLAEILACPQCRGGIELLPDGSGLVCRGCRLKYPIREDIPIMLVDEAENISE